MPRTATVVMVTAMVVTTAVAVTVVPAAAVGWKRPMTVSRRTALVGDGGADEGDGKRSEKRKDQKGCTASWGQFDSCQGGWRRGVSYEGHLHL